MTCAPSEDSDKPGHPPSVTRVFAVCMEKPWVLSFPVRAQLRFRSDFADAQGDLSLRWAHKSNYCFYHGAARLCCSFKAYYLSHDMRSWHFSSSVNSVFKRICAAIQWSKMSDVWSNPSSTSMLNVCEQRRLRRDCTDTQSRRSLRWLPM